MTLEEALARIVELEENIAALETQTATLTEDITAKDTRITELQEHNQKLFLKITTKEENNTEEEPEPGITDFLQKHHGIEGGLS